MNTLRNEISNNNVLNGIKLVNLTPYDLTIFKEDGGILKINPSGKVARVKASEKKIGSVNNVSVSIPRFNDIENIPEPKDGVLYIVSLLVLSVNAATINPRIDLISPNTTQYGNDIVNNGVILGEKGFITM